MSLARNSSRFSTGIHVTSLYLSKLTTIWEAFWSQEADNPFVPGCPARGLIFCIELVVPVGVSMRDSNCLAGGSLVEII